MNDENPTASKTFNKLIAQARTVRDARLAREPELIVKARAALSDTFAAFADEAEHASVVWRDTYSSDVHYVEWRLPLGLRMRVEWRDDETSTTRLYTDAGYDIMYVTDAEVAKFLAERTDAFAVDRREQSLREWWGPLNGGRWIDDPLDRTNYLMNELERLTDLVATARADRAELVSFVKRVTSNGFDHMTESVPEIIADIIRRKKT